MTDDFDDPIEGDRARVESRFRELEMQAEIDRMRREQGSGGASSGSGATSSASDGRDPLADMKAALDGNGDERATKETKDGGTNDNASNDAERYVLALCPGCDAKNRISLTRLRAGNPICGGCKKPLSFTR